ncbi:hypothetical protein NFI96_024698 [Prochilodus magdalenae]|nr:hypothetical protein NFI96_024698 [Prochilodus magdalenae]
MAEDSNISVDQLQFSCSICLDLLRDPVTTPCGHSFCMVCINDFWDHATQRGVYSCPQCREAFMPRPVLRRNNVMAEVVDKLKRKDLKSPSPVQNSSESGDVECDICSENKDKAIKSCLVCLASFCETHLRPHYESPAFKKHKLVQACTQLQEKICSRHDKLIEIYCRTDQKFICSVCMLGGHKGHDTACLAVERSEKQSQMKEIQRKSQQRIQEKQKKAQDLKQAVNTLRRSAQAAVDESERFFSELVLSIEEKCSKVTELIRAQERTELDRAEGLLEQLEQEIADLKRKQTDLEQLEQTEDHFHYLKSFQSLYSAYKAKDSARVTISQHLSFDRVRKSLSELKERLDEFCKDEFDKINPYVVKVQIVLPFEPKTREEFLQYFCHLTLDPNTANEALSLSENNRKVSRSGGLMAYPYHPERFDGYGQVLCKESVSGRSYWEVEWSRGGWVYISVSYKGISRKGQSNECWFGHNNQSWSLECNSTLSFWHNNIQTKIPGPFSSRIGVESETDSGGEYSKMAEASISIDQEYFNCSICLQQLNDPVTTPCGHSFCMVCINSFWDSEQVYSCPQCREAFTPRPVLRRNNILAEVVRTLQQAKLQDSLPDCLDFSSIEGQDVDCDFCMGKKKKAVRSCLTCLASYCDAHLQPHHESATFKKHKLVPAFRNLQERTCAQHDKLLEVFCRTDSRVICSLCLLDKHKGHNTVSVQEEWMEKKKHLEGLKMKYQNRHEERETILLELKELMESFKSSAQAAVEDSEKIFTDLILLMEKRRSEATELIRACEKAELDKAVGLKEQLEQEIAEVNRKQTDLQQLQLQTNDYIHSVQRSQFFCADLETNGAVKVAFNHQPAFVNFKTSLVQLKKQLESICTEEWKNISENVNHQIILEPEAETREEFLKYAREITLDPNTVNYYLLLLECNTKVISDSQRHSYLDCPERFGYWQQVLSKQRVSLRSYWEAEVGGENGVSIAVTSKAIKRKGSELESRFGHNAESCRLVCYPTKYNFWHNNKQIEIPGPTYRRIGVYLDEQAGTLAFYGVSNKMNLIHKVTIKFTLPLYAGFGVGSGSYANICMYASSGATGKTSK